MLAELLSKWAELEPRICQQDDDRWFQVDLNDDRWEDIDSHGDEAREMAWLQYAVQTAIVDRNLRCKLENEANGWVAAVVDGEKYAAGQDKESAVALLKAYIGYLEGKS